MRIECDMCKTKIECKDYNTFTLEGIDYNIKKVICDTCAKKVAKIIAQNDKREITHTIVNVISADGMVFRLTVKVDGIEYYIKDFDSYRAASNFILPLVKLKNRYSKQIMLNKLNELK